MEVFDKPVGWFESITDAARKLGYNKDSISNRIKKDLVVLGVRIRYPKEGEEYTNLPNLSPPKVYGKSERPKGNRGGKVKAEKPKEEKRYSRNSTGRGTASFPTKYETSFNVSLLALICCHRRLWSAA